MQATGIRPAKETCCPNRYLGVPKKTYWTGDLQVDFLEANENFHTDIQAARVTRRKQNQNMCCKSIYFQYYLQKKCSHDVMASWQWAPYSPPFSIYLHTLCVNNMATHYITICLYSRLPRNNWHKGPV